MCEMNHYEVLGVDKEASSEEIKAKYRKIILTEHPDKAGQIGEAAEVAQDRFIAIQKAFNTLRDPLLREEYNQYLLEEERKNAVVINAEIEIDDFEEFKKEEWGGRGEEEGGEGEREGEGGFGEEEVFFGLVCRCGGWYWTCESWLAEGKEVVPCDGCSLYVRVLFDVEEEE